MSQLPFPEALFASKEYVDSYARSLHSCRKVFDSFLEYDLTDKLKNGGFEQFDKVPELFESIEIQDGTKIHTRNRKFDVPVDLFRADLPTFGQIL